MARKVFVSSDMSSDEAISEVSEIDAMAGLMWPWILTYFDDWGRAKASPREIKNSVFQANDLITLDIIKQALQLYGVKLVKLYEVKGKPYMCIDPDKWFKYQTHIRREKRENDGSKLPPPDDNSAQVREGARDSAQISDNLTNCIPSPSPSPSLSKDTTTTAAEVLEQAMKETAATIEEESVMDIHKKVFGTLFMNGLMSEYVNKIKSLGYQDAFIKELMLETGESGNNPSLRLMETIGTRWMKEGIYTRAESKRRHDEEKCKVVIPFQSSRQPYPVAVGQAVSNLDETKDILAEMERLKEVKRQRLAAQKGEST